MVTVRTIKLKRANADGEPSSLTESASESAPGADPVAESAPQAADPVPVTPLARGNVASSKSYQPFVIAATVTVIVLLAVMAFQYLEISLYQAEPSVWVKK